MARTRCRPRNFLVKMLQKQKNLSFLQSNTCRETSLNGKKTDKSFVMEIELLGQDTSIQTKRGFIAAYVITGSDYLLAKRIAKQFQCLIKENIRFKLQEYVKAFEESLFSFKNFLNSSEFMSNETEIEYSDETIIFNEFSFKAILFYEGQLIISQNFQNVEAELSELQVQILTNTGTHFINEEQEEIEDANQVIVINKQQGIKKEQPQLTLYQQQNRDEQNVIIVDPKISQNMRKLIVTNRSFNVQMFDDNFEKQYPKTQGLCSLHYLKISFIKQSDYQESENEQNMNVIDK